MLTDRAPVRALIIALSGAVSLSGLAMVVLAAMTVKANPLASFVLALELVVILAGVFGVMVGLGRVKIGQAVTLVCVGATVAAAAQVGPLIVDGQLAGITLRPYVLGRSVLGLVLIVLAGVIVLSRRPGQSVPMLIKGVLWGAPLAIALAIASGVGPLAGVKTSVTDALTNLPNIGQIIAALGAFVVFCVLISASGHYLIRAFIVGVDAAEQAEARSGM